MKQKNRIRIFGSVIAVTMLLAACGSGSDGGGGTVPSHAVGGMVSGLSGTSLVLQNNSSDDLTISTNGTFTFATQVVDGGAYRVTVKTQPTDLRCIVQTGSGAVNGSPVTNVVVTCPMAYKNSLAWMRCTYGQQWNATTGDCTGTGNSGNNYGATVVQFCSTSNNNCNRGVSGGTLTTPINGSTSSLYDACNGLNGSGGTYGKTTWRVPAKDELKGIVVCSNGPSVPLADFTACNAGYSSPTLDTQMFPNTVGAAYLSSSAMDSSYAYGLYFTNGFVNNEPKVYINDYVRCVSGP